MTLSTNLGFPRIGKNREFKKTIESFWKGEIETKSFEQKLEQIHLDALKTQIDAKLDFIPLGDFSAYDLMLETALMLGVVPKRVKHLTGWKRYYAMARGTQEITPCEMKKWFDTNYHYIVPEIEGSFSLDENRLPTLYQWARSQFPKTSFRPVLIGPYTFLKLCRIKNEKTLEENLKNLKAIYQEIITTLSQTDCEWVQMDEPALCGDVTPSELKAIQDAYRTLTAQKGNLKIMLQTYFGDLTPIYKEVTSLPVDGIGFDLVKTSKNKEAIKTLGFPKEKWIGLGVINGRNIWKTALSQTLNLLEEMAQTADPLKIFVHPSCSLIYQPLSLEGENKIPSVLKKRLSFALERLAEISILTKGLTSGRSAIEKELRENEALLQDREFGSFAKRSDVQIRVQNLKEKDFKRPSSYEQRITEQQKHLNLSPLPTTTIGSFPQTQEIRQARNHWKKGEINEKEYQKFLHKEMETVIRLQEEIGLDVLVHGEPERTDMVEYFAEQLHGFQCTENGWVQSYGTRCVRAPIIYGDVTRKQPMTLAFSKAAQAMTKKPMKGMLTGPVTILNWSFVRDDIPRSETSFQIGLALRDEVEDLEKNGIHVIQIDEPALREGLPLKKGDWEAYLQWAVKSFKLCSSGVKDTTQIHSHMCYSEFGDIIASIQALDADVLSIEDSRSAGKLAKDLAEKNYKNGIGPGVYDVHSERIPHKEEFEKAIRFLVENIPLSQLWINPDCGLKTRGYKETTASLKNMVAAVKEVRKTLAR